MEQFLKDIGIDIPGQAIDGRYVIDLGDMDTFGKVFSKLDNSESVEESTDSHVNGHASRIIFESDEYIITLISDLDSDNYRLICSRGDN